MPEYVETPEGSVAGYQPPSEGPFKCSNCNHFDADEKTCDKPELEEELGTNKVEPNGCCNFFEKGEEMPISDYFRGSGDKVMKSMKKEYGKKKGKNVFYATANKKDMTGPSKDLKKKRGFK